MIDLITKKDLALAKYTEFVKDFDYNYRNILDPSYLQYEKSLNQSLFNHILRFPNSNKITLYELGYFRRQKNEETIITDNSVYYDYQHEFLKQHTKCDIQTFPKRWNVKGGAKFFSSVKRINDFIENIQRKHGFVFYVKIYFYNDYYWKVEYLEVNYPAKFTQCKKTIYTELKKRLAEITNRSFPDHTSLDYIRCYEYLEKLPKDND